MLWGEPDLVKHIVNADATWKRLQVLLANIIVLRYHGIAFFKALGNNSWFMVGYGAGRKIETRSISEKTGR